MIVANIYRKYEQPSIHADKKSGQNINHYFGYIMKTENLLSELFSLYYNSRSFKKYSNKIKQRKKPDDDGYILLVPSELENLSSCLISILTSKKVLVEYGINIDYQ